MRLFNTLSRQVEEVRPLEDNHIKMYTCGITVYSQPQIGNWVAYIYSDVLTRVLKYNNFNVLRVQNITDVGHLVSDDDSGEDKMEKGARAEGKTAWEVAEKYIKIADDEAYAKLRLLRPDKIIRATDLISEQIEFAKKLELKGFTYIIPNEGLYFDTSKLSDYGKLARLDIDGLQAGKRVDVTGKKNGTDFALWKLSPKNSKRDMEWDSPWGTGFPGWHLECSVIARESLGDQIDIHTGGIDHIPVHHTNEIAQTESLTGKTFSQMWFHNNHIKINGAKLAKSAGNSFIISDILKRGIDLNSFKVMVLSSHYRTEGNFSWEILDASQSRFRRWCSVAVLKWQLKPVAQRTPDMVDKTAFESIKGYTEALSNDLNTPLALSYIDKVMDSFEDRMLVEHEATVLIEFIELIEQTVGIAIETEDISADQKATIADRETARNRKDWAEADRLRDELIKQNICIKDTDDGPIWAKDN